MRVAFDARGASDQRGVGRYVRCLLAALRTTGADGDEVVEEHHPRGFDVYHSPWIDGTHLHLRCPQVVTIHDLVALKRRSEYLRTGVRFRLRYMAAQRAARVIVPTLAVKEDVVAHLRVDPQRVTVIAEAAAPVMTPRDDTEVAKVRRRYGLPQDYLVWVGGLEYPDPRKRVAELADTPRDLPLVLVGPAKHWAYELAGDRPDITVTGHVADDDLAAIYTGARALVLPSDDEGFGLPTVEALACGTPVVACDVPALREVLGDRATFVECDDLTRLLAVAAEAARPAPGPPPWTWEDAARSTWATYRDVAGDGSG